MTTLYMPLEAEGTEVWVPIEADPVGDGRFRVRGPMPTDQRWRFSPGTIVVAQNRRFADDSEGLEAVRISN